MLRITVSYDQQRGDSNMPKDTHPEDMNNGAYEARKVPGANSFNVYDECGAMDGYLFNHGKGWFVTILNDTSGEPAGPYEDAEEAFTAVWGNF